MESPFKVDKTSLGSIMNQENNQKGSGAAQ